MGTEDPRTLWLVAAGGLFVLFVTLVLRDDRLTRRLRRFEELRDASARGLARLDRDFDRLPPCPAADELLGPGAAGGSGADRGGPMPAFVRDLHLFGHGSLFRLLSTARTPTGRRTLARWLAEPADPAEIARRQEAVRALAGRLDFRQELEAAGTGVLEEAPDLERFYRWAEGEPWLARHRVRLWIARVLTVLVPGGLVACVLGHFPWDLWFTGVLAGYVFSAANVKA
ncbi:MAG: hypothetical protein PVG07_16240, partial [Acidobacteriota bacterium]